MLSLGTNSQVPTSIDDQELSSQVDSLVSRIKNYSADAFECYRTLVARFGHRRIHKYLDGDRLFSPRERLFFESLIEPSEPNGVVLSTRQRTDRARICRNWNLTPTDLAQRFPTGPKGPSFEFLSKLSAFSSKVDLATAEPLLHTVHTARTAPARSATYSGISSSPNWIPCDVARAMELSEKFPNVVLTRRGAGAQKRRKLRDGSGAVVVPQQEEPSEEPAPAPAPDAEQCREGEHDAPAPQLGAETPADDGEGRPAANMEHSGLETEGHCRSSCGVEAGLVEPEQRNMGDSDMHTDTFEAPPSPDAPSAAPSDISAEMGRWHDSQLHEESDLGDDDVAGPETFTPRRSSQDQLLGLPPLSSPQGRKAGVTMPDPQPTPAQLLPPPPLALALPRGDTGNPPVRHQDLSLLLESLPRLHEGRWLDDVLVNAAISRCRSPAVGTIDSLTICATYTTARNRHRSLLDQLPPAKEVVLLPHCSGGHWRLFCWRRGTGEPTSADGRTRTLEVYDSLSSATRSGNPLAPAAEHAQPVISFLSRTTKIPAEDFVATHKQCPQQPNPNDCGVYVVAFAQAIARHRAVPPRIRAPAVREWLRNTLPTYEFESPPSVEGGEQPALPDPKAASSRGYLLSVIALGALHGLATTVTCDSGVPMHHPMLGAAAAQLELLGIQLSSLREQIKQMPAEHMRALTDAVRLEHQAKQQGSQIRLLREFLQKRPATTRNRVQSSASLPIAPAIPQDIGRGTSHTVDSVEFLLDAVAGIARAVDSLVAPGSQIASGSRPAIAAMYRSSVVWFLILRYAARKRQRLEDGAAALRCRLRSMIGAGVSTGGALAETLEGT